MSEDNIIKTPEVTREPTECIGLTLFSNMKNHKDKVAQVIIIS